MKFFGFAVMWFFLRPLVFMWCWEYLHEDFSLPMLGYWKCFWLLVLVGHFRGIYKMTYTEFKKEYELK